MNSLRAFKVVKPVGVHYTSCMLKGVSRVFYPVGDFVEADPELFKLGFGLAVFKTFYTAKQFIGNSDRDNKVFLAEIENPIIKFPKRCRTIREVDAYLRMVKDNGSNYWYQTDFWPDQTMLVQRVKLLERLSG